MRAWKEAALQLEQENARLLDLNNVRLDPRLTYITGRGDGGQRLSLPAIGAAECGRSAMASVDGWAAMDGIGLVGRISGVRAGNSPGHFDDRRGELRFLPQSSLRARRR